MDFKGALHSGISHIAKLYQIHNTSQYNVNELIHFIGLDVYNYFESMKMEKLIVTVVEKSSLKVSL